jgi:hypothetical protein
MRRMRWRYIRRSGRNLNSRRATGASSGFIWAARGCGRLSGGDAGGWSQTEASQSAITCSLTLARNVTRRTRTCDGRTRLLGHSLSRSWMLLSAMPLPGCQSFREIMLRIQGVLF